MRHALFVALASIVGCNDPSGVPDAPDAAEAMDTPAPSDAGSDAPSLDALDAPVLDAPEPTDAAGDVPSIDDAPVLIDAPVDAPVDAPADVPLDAPADAGRCAVDGLACDDGDPCTSADTCMGGRCAGTPVVDFAEPNDSELTAASLGAVSDTETFPAGSSSGSLHSVADEDWYAYDVRDDRGLLAPRVDLTDIPAGHDDDLCAYYRCDNGATASITCLAGTPATGTDPGCCSRAAGTTAESVHFEAQCGGGLASDDGRVFVHVTSADRTATCAPYTLRWGDD